MFKRKQLYTALVSTSLLAAVSMNTLAQTPAVTDATVTVQNTFVLTELTPLNLGTIRATADPAGTVQATYIVNANGTTSVPASGGPAAAISELVEGEPATYEVSGAAGFADIDVTVTTPASDELTLSGAPPGTPVFSIGTFTTYITSGPNINTAYVATTNEATTDVAGSVTFSVGATLSTDDAASTEAYADGDYVGNYTVTVSY